MHWYRIGTLYWQKRNQVSELVSGRNEINILNLNEGMSFGRMQKNEFHTAGESLTRTTENVVPAHSGTKLHSHHFGFSFLTHK